MHFKNILIDFGGNKVNMCNPNAINHIKRICGFFCYILISWCGFLYIALTFYHEKNRYFVFALNTSSFFCLSCIRVLQFVYFLHIYKRKKIPIALFAFEFESIFDQKWKLVQPVIVCFFLYNVTEPSSLLAVVSPIRANNHTKGISLLWFTSGILGDFESNHENLPFLNRESKLNSIEYPSILGSEIQRDVYGISRKLVSKRTDQ